ncbi:MAG: hypothetical protein JSW61_12845 [Candidatus Thorarchaeota archaeon]|nr:MAG: hypothetical protein JSW61_12845 [Candidatus Thorarchaeota archaeon]
MSMDLERALSKLRFDDQVIGYSLMTKAGRPFVSFAFPDELFPRVKDSINLYKSDLRLMTIDTDRGLVVLSPVDENWILTVLYVPELQLGLAIAKTKNVLRLLEGVELPPPPEEFEDAAEDNLQVLESIAMKAAATEAPPPEPEPAPAEALSEPSATADAPAETEVTSPESFSVTTTTVPERGEAYASALSLESDLYSEMKSAYRNFGFDVLMLVDGSKNVEEIADTMFQSTERVSDLLKWAASRKIVTVPEGGEEAVAAEEAAMGRFVKCPKFEGDLSKIQGPDIEIVKLCNGSLTPEQIAEKTGVAHPKVIQILAKYRKYGMRMIGKTR